MDDDLEEGALSAEGTQATAEPAGPSLIDTLDEEFGFDDRGEAQAPAADAAQPAAVDPAASAVAKPEPEAKPDPNADMYAPLPEHNQRKTHERFQKLVDSHKEISTKFESTAQEVTQLKGTLQQYEAGLQPLREMGFDSQEAVADLQQFSQYRKALASGNIDAAMGLLQQQMQQLALASGRRVEVNPLQAFPDLSERVRVGDVDEATALELARSRYTQGVQSRQHQQQQQVNASSEAQTRAIREGAQAVDAAVVELMKSPDYAAVEPALIPKLADIKRNYLPHQWAGVIKQTYDYERRLLAAQQSQAQTSRPAPLRGSGHMGGQPAPKSAAEAAMQALGIN